MPATASRRDCPCSTTSICRRAEWPMRWLAVKRSNNDGTTNTRMLRATNTSSSETARRGSRVESRIGYPLELELKRRVRRVVERGEVELLQRRSGNRTRHQWSGV